MSDFKPIPGYEELYRINSDGVVQTRWTKGKYKTLGDWQRLKAWRARSGHHYVSLAQPRKHFLVHRLVLILFGPPQPFAGALALHKEDKRDDNSVNNLYWGTYKDNHNDRVRLGTATKPPMRSILTPADVLAIRAVPRVRGYRILLAKQFPQVSLNSINQVLYGYSWRHV